jgi:hypothetical protein
LKFCWLTGSLLRGQIPKTKDQIGFETHVAITMIKIAVKLITTFVALTLICHLGVCQQGNKFVFTQLKYDGRWDPYPDSWPDILEFLVTTMSIRPLPERRVITIDNDLLFSSPFLVIAGVEKFPELTEPQRLLFRKYMYNGGLVFVEDSSGIKGGEFDSTFRKEISKVFPEMNLRKFPMEHPIYRSFYLLRKTGGRRLTNNYLEGIDISGRTALIYSQNDLLGTWAKDRFGNYLWECVPGGQDQRFEAQKLTLNIIMYSVTGTYKSDAIHKPYIEQKLNQ